MQQSPSRRAPALVAPLLLLLGCGAAPPAPTDGGACTIELPAGANAVAAPGPTPLLPGAQRLSPAGRQIPLGGFPLGLAVLPGGRFLVTGDAGFGVERLRVVDLAAGSVVEEREVPSHFLGLATTADGKRLFASSPNDGEVLVFEVGERGTLTRRDALRTLDYPSGLALSSDGKLLLVAAAEADQLHLLDAATGVERRRIPVGENPHQVIAGAPSRPDEAYVSLWGGAGVAIVDLRRGQVAETILTGKNPTGLALSRDGKRLYVANGDEDTISELDLEARRLLRSVPLDPAQTLLPGLSPSDLTVDGSGRRLLVAAAGANAVIALDLATLAPLGALPTAWYPVSLATLGDGRVAVVSAKGNGPGPNPKAAFISDLMRGSLALIDAPTDGALAAGASAVAANNAAPRSHQPKVSCPPGTRFPVPLQAGDPTPLRRVILLVRENKTYDAVLGDLKGANGDPSLVLFGEEVTPNLHALARQFTSLDNFYANAEQSVQGHAWTTGAMANDFIEKAWFTLPGYRADRRSGADLLTKQISRPRYGSFFEHLEALRVDFVVWGEIVGFRDLLGARFDGQFPGVVYNLEVPDVDKADYVIGRLKAGFLPRFSYLLLPRDHTYGTLPGKPTPQAMVAENDLATGRLVDALSRSKLWAETVLFLIEDDPQDGGDHVEAHRSICLVISPYARRGATVSTHYDMASLYRTIEAILGVPPMNRGDAQAAILYDAFTERPDPRPFTVEKNRIDTQSENRADAPLAEESRRMDFSQPDRAPGLGRVLWRAIKGREPPWVALPDDDD